MDVTNVQSANPILSVRIKNPVRSNDNNFWMVRLQTEPNERMHFTMLRCYSNYSHSPNSESISAGRSYNQSGRTTQSPMSCSVRRPMHISDAFTTASDLEIRLKLSVSTSNLPYSENKDVIVSMSKPYETKMRFFKGFIHVEFKGH